MNSIAQFDGLLRNVRYTRRGLKRNPGYRILAILTLGVGIGLTPQFSLGSIECCCGHCLMRMRDRSCIWIRLQRKLGRVLWASRFRIGGAGTKEKSRHNRNPSAPPSLRSEAGRESLGRVQDPATLLFLAQGYHGVYLAGPPSWDDCGSQCHNS